MSNVILVLNPGKIAEMKKYYAAHLAEKTPPGGIFAAKPANCTITAYQSGKVLFQGAASETEAGKWSHGATAPTTPAKKTAAKASSVKTHRYSPPANIGELSIVGSDEVGTGDYFGPMTVVAVYAKREHIPLLKELGVKDSKNLNDKQIAGIASQIKHIVPYSLLTCENPKYNSMQSKGMSQGKMKALLHNQAIKYVINKIAPEKPEAVLIDQFAQPDVFFNYLKGQELFQAEAVYLSTKAEGIHVAVAAASILARYAFVKHFEKLSEKAGFIIPKGAGPAVDQACARLIHEKGISVLNEFTKLHFANTEKSKAIYQKKYKNF
ncbi:ribonuclease HIII [Peribacillus cavernae]|uniref:Ribonuclease HIII n=1 Tax=Peribacillus cavernae TaxID=1674310 RepID=A0A433H763_9BACI|nr:ribonuclease HIII [Peribacillus cavernae]MDQ0220116.1 ribonuclease HIII [Peribacillus cavernae]RUQ24177.1 ribonuclease HIII [Peribacillus cavernae]